MHRLKLSYREQAPSHRFDVQALPMHSSRLGYFAQGGGRQGCRHLEALKAASLKLWEGACSRWRCVSQLMHRLKLSYREQAPSHN